MIFDTRIALYEEWPQPRPGPSVPIKTLPMAIETLPLPNDSAKTPKMSKADTVAPKEEGEVSFNLHTARPRAGGPMAKGTLPTTSNHKRSLHAKT